MTSVPTSTLFFSIGFCAGCIAIVVAFIVIAVLINRNDAKKEQKMAEAVLKHMDVYDE